MWQEYFGKDLVTIYGIDVNPYCKVSGADLALRQSPERNGTDLTTQVHSSRACTQAGVTSLTEAPDCAQALFNDPPWIIVFTGNQNSPCVPKP